MRTFKVTYQLQRAVLVYLVRNRIDKKEKEQLQIMFEQLDNDKDGDITLKEFVLNFKTKFNISVVESEMVRIIRSIDITGERTISFTEFLIGASNKQNLLCEANLAQSFCFIDKDQDQFITRNDLPAKFIWSLTLVTTFDV